MLTAGETPDVGHLGNISIVSGRSLKFDGASERYGGDTEADGLLGGTYRAPYTLPAEDV